MAQWKKPTQITAWSFSRYRDYQKCPLYAKLKHIDKLAEPGNAAMDRGAGIHKDAEYYIRGVTKSLPAIFKPFAAQFKAWRKMFATNKEMVVEDMWHLTSKWTMTHGRDWDAIWLRVKLDICTVETVGDVTHIGVPDIKSGRINERYNIPEYKEQLSLYGAGALIKYSDKGVNIVVKPSLVFVDAGVSWPPPDQTITYTPADLPGLKAEWNKKVKPMLSDKTFAPKPGRMCEYCHFRRGNSDNGGGQCAFG